MTSTKILCKDQSIAIYHVLTETIIPYAVQPFHKWVGKQFMMKQHGV